MHGVDVNEPANIFHTMLSSKNRRSSPTRWQDMFFYSRKMLAVTFCFALNLMYSLAAGPIPQELGNLDALKCLNLRDNQLTGESSSAVWYSPEMLEKKLSTR